MCESECPICMEIIDLCKNCATTECGHKFHSNCLMRSIAFNGFGCPYCRFEMVEEIADSEDDEDDEEYGDEGDRADDDADDGDNDDGDDADGTESDADDDVIDPNEPLPSFELIQKKFIEKGITYESLVKTIMFNSLIYHKKENFEDYQKCNTFMEELFFDIVTKYKPEQEEDVVKQNKEFNFYFLEDEYSQRKYQKEMETTLEKFLDLNEDNYDNEDVLNILNNPFLNNRFMELV